MLPQRQSGVASGVNNAASRIGQMVSVAVLGALLVAGFRSGLAEHLAGTGLPPGAVGEMIGRARLLGELMPPQGLAADLHASVAHAIRRAFVDGFRLVMLVSAALSCTSLGLFVACLRRAPQYGDV